MFAGTLPALAGGTFRIVVAPCPCFNVTALHTSPAAMMGSPAPQNQLFPGFRIVKSAAKRGERQQARSRRHYQSTTSVTDTDQARTAQHRQHNDASTNVSSDDDANNDANDTKDTQPQPTCSQSLTCAGTHIQ
jgi:hypothetical protein